MKMYRKLIVLVVAVFVGLAAEEECRAQYDHLKFGESKSAAHYSFNRFSVSAL